MATKDIIYTEDYLDELFEKRIIIINGEINEETSAEWVGRISLLELQGAKTKKPIIILINTFGGDPHCALSIADIIESCICPTMTVCIGLAISGGSIILAAGAKRYSTPHGNIMIHQQQMDMSPRNHTELVNETIASKVLYKQLEDYYMKVTKQTRPKIKKLLQKDSYLTAFEALEIGLIDDIGWKINEWVK